MKKYTVYVAICLVLSACVSTKMAATPSTAASVYSRTYTPEQYQKLAEAINNNKAQILEQLNKEAKKLEGKSFTIGGKAQ